MRRHVKLIATISCLVFLMSSLTVLAAGTSSVSVSTNSPGVGDTFTVTATATESGKMSVKYNQDVLSVVNCDVSGYSQSAGEVDFSGKRGTITFKANAAGNSAISVSSDKASGSSMVITVGGAAAGAASEDFEYNGVKYTVSEKFAAEEVPGGFAVTEIAINGKNLKGVSNGQMTLVYLKPVDNVAGQGTFYIYDAATNSVKEYFFLGRPDYYVIPGKPSELLSDQLKSGTLDVDGRQVEIYSLDGVEGFVYVYGTSSTNVTGWFQYDTTEKTVQRVNEAFFNNNSSSNASENEESLLDKVKAINIRYIIAGVIFLAIVIIAVIINIVLKKKDDKADLIDGDEEVPVEEDDTESDLEPLDKQSKKEEKKRRREEKKREKEERKAAKKEERRRRKEEYFDDEEEDIYDEYDDFDIDKSIDDLTVSDEPKVAKEAEKEIVKLDDKQAESETLKTEDVPEKSEAKTEKPKAKTEKTEDIPEKTNNQLEDNSDDFAFWEDEKDIKKELKKRKKESKKKKNVFGDDELDLHDEINSRIDKSNDLKKSDAKSGGSDIIDFNDF